MKIVLILANAGIFSDGSGWANTKHRYAYAPTTLTTLAALVPGEFNADITLIDEGVENIPENIKADIIGISTTTCNAPHTYDMADSFRKQGITVIIGGHHATMMPDEAARHADAVVVGYAEESWPRLLQDYKHGRLQKKYTATNPAQAFNRLPVIPRKLLKKCSYFTDNTIEATRGCLNQCHPCVIGNLHQGKLYKRPISSIVEEIKQMTSRNIYFLDSNMTDDLEYCIQLYEALIPLKIKWYASATTRALGNPEWLDLALRSGLKGALTGFESINSTSLDSIGKSAVLPDRFKQIITNLHSHGVAILGCFIFGLDGDGKNVFDATTKFVEDSKIDLAQYAIFTPFPGSTAWHQLEKEGRIISREWHRYDGKHVVYSPQLMTRHDLQQGFFRAWRKTYSVGSIAKRFFRFRQNPLLYLAANLGYRFFGSLFIPPHTVSDAVQPPDGANHA